MSEHRHEDEYYEDLFCQDIDDISEDAIEALDREERDEEIEELEREDGVLNPDDYPDEDGLDEI